VVYTTVY